MQFPKEKISASLVNLYNSCPLGFKLTVVDGLIQKEGPALKMGSMFDEMFKAFHKGKDPFKAVKSHKDKDGNLDLWSEPPTKLQIEHFGLCRKLIEKYTEDPDKFKNPIFDVGFGVPLITSTKEKLKYLISGYLDGIDRDSSILSIRGIEVKTTGETAKEENPWSQKRVDEELQATIYIYYLYQKYGELYPLDYIIFNKKTLDIKRFTTKRTLEDFDKLFLTLTKFIKDVEDEKFDKNPNHPYYCPCRQLS